MLAKLPELNKTCDVFIKQAHDINLGYGNFISRYVNFVSLDDC